MSFIGHVGRGLELPSPRATEPEHQNNEDEANGRAYDGADLSVREAMRLSVASV